MVSLLPSCVTACGGGAPLLHPAHPLPEGDVTIGAGFSAAVPVNPQSLAEGETAERAIEEGAFAEGIAPWVGGRYGLDGSWDAGLTYTGRTVRVDGRYAFDVGGPFMSLGLGASGLLPKRRDDLGLRVGGFGGDLPILIGIASDADIYAGWLGARAGMELLRGQREIPPDPLDPSAPIAEQVDGWHAYAGGLVGFRIGFRHVFAAMELGGAMHWAKGSVGDREVSLRQFGLSPAGALIVRF